MSGAAPLSGRGPLIDVHAHFYYEGCGRPNWRALNASRLAAGDRIGVTWHVGSILGSWGASSPTYFQSPADTVAGNDEFWPVFENHLDAMVNPDYTDEEIRREVRNFGVAREPDGSLRLEEKGTVYAEMVRS